MPIVVYYDGACEKCVKDRENYESMAGVAGRDVQWFDITDKEDELKALGIDPQLALSELHIRDDAGNILSELDAYILLMRRVPRLKPLAWLIALPLIRPLLAALYHASVLHRLRRDGRLKKGT
ncbi:MAG: DUF393 domain-containing protein [Mariprofundaceae bacterium]|nr:DUF393 domain-containing protein [Mariprofundaceae bacterium]